MGLFRDKRMVSPLQISGTEMVAVCSRLQSYFPDETCLELDEIKLHSSSLKRAVEDLLKNSVNLGDQKLFEFVNSVSYSASDNFFELKPENIAQCLSDDFHLYLHVFQNYHRDAIVRTGALSLIQAFRIKLSKFPQVGEIFDYLSTSDSELYAFLDLPISESFYAP